MCPLKKNGPLFHWTSLLPDKPTRKSWRSFLENRARLIGPLLDRMTISTLGEFNCLYVEGCRWPKIKLAEDSPTVESLPLETQGIFLELPDGREVNRFESEKRVISTPQCGFNWDSGHTYICGLTRQGQWVLGKVEFGTKKGKFGGMHEYATRVAVESVDIDALLSNKFFRPMDMHKALGDTIKQYYEQLTERCQDVAERVQVIRTDDELIEYLGYSWRYRCPSE